MNRLDIPSLLPQCVQLLLGNFVGGDSVGGCVDQHDHWEKSSTKQGKCNTAKEIVSRRDLFEVNTQNLQANQRVTRRLSVHTIGNSLTNGLETPERSSVADVF